MHVNGKVGKANRETLEKETGETGREWWKGEGGKTRNGTWKKPQQNKKEKGRTYEGRERTATKWQHMARDGEGNWTGTRAWAWALKREGKRTGKGTKRK